MKKVFTVLLFFCTISLFGQTSMSYLQDGISKQEKKEYDAAIKAYTKAIDINYQSKEAFYNRGTCELILKNYEAAQNDFTRTIALDANFVKAYYSRATVLVSQEKYEQALTDLNKIITLDPKTPNALTLRGQIRAQTRNKVGACEDFNLAKQYGDANAEKYIKQFCQAMFPEAKKESLELEWPNNWKIGDDQEDKTQHVVDYIPANESIENWTELGNMTRVKNVAGVPMDKAMNLMYEGIKTSAPNATLTFIEKDENTPYPWVIFTIESPNLIDDPTPESQLWYVVQGKNSLYLNFRAIKKASIPENLKTKWIKFFKTAKVLYK